MALHEQRCRNHELREAVALCPGCREFFCRECITEHDDRVICAACLRKLGNQKEGGRRLSGLLTMAQVIAGLVAAWLCFYMVGRALLTIPVDAHEATYWKKSFWDE